MTHHPIRTLPDGTRVYSNGARYKPVADEARKYNRRKSGSETEFFWRGEWYEPKVFLPEEERKMPATIRRYKK